MKEGQKFFQGAITNGNSAFSNIFSGHTASTGRFSDFMFELASWRSHSAISVKVALSNLFDKAPFIKLSMSQGRHASVDTVGLNDHLMAEYTKSCVTSVPVDELYFVDYKIVQVTSFFDSSIFIFSWLSAAAAVCLSVAVALAYSLGSKNFTAECLVSKASETGIEEDAATYVDGRTIVFVLAAAYVMLGGVFAIKTQSSPLYFLIGLWLNIFFSSMFPASLVLSMGLHYLNYIKGEVTTNVVSFSLFVDLVNTASYFVRCSLQFGRVMIFLMYYVNSQIETLGEAFMLLDSVDSSEPVVAYTY